MAEFEKKMHEEDWMDFADGNVHEATADSHRRIYQLTERLFPTKWTKKRSTDDPRIDDETRDMIVRWKRVFVKEHRSRKWCEIKTKTNNMIQTRRKKFYDAEA